MTLATSTLRILSTLCLVGLFLAVLAFVFPPAPAYSGSLEENGMPSSSISAVKDAKNSTAISCAPTKPDMLGPFYEPGAPVRSEVGHGYLLAGTVKSANNCSPIEGARVELWLASPNGKYDDAHRAVVISKDSGQYKFESNFPPSYQNRPPHIHVRVAADGYKTLVTQHYPKEGETKGTFDLVLVPEKA